MKIIYYTDSLGSGGAERQLVYTALEAEKRGNKVLIVIDHPTFHYKYMLEGSNIEVICTNTNRFNPIKRFFKLKQIVKQFKPDIFHSFLSMKNLWGMFISYLEKVPIRISSVRGISKGDFRGINLYNKWSSKIVFNSEYGRNISIRKYNIEKDKTITIYNGIRVMQFYTENSKTKQFLRDFGLENKIVGTFAASISPVKNHLEFFSSLCILRKEGYLNNIHFLIVGKIGDSKLASKLKYFVSQEKLESYVTFLGERKDISLILSASDFLILPSIRESLPNVIMESMASKTFVIASAVGGIPELISDSKTGLLIDTPNSYGIKKAIMRYLSLSSTEREEIIQKAYLKILNLSVENMYSKLESIYYNKIY